MELTYAEIDRIYRHISHLKDSIGTTLSRPDRAVVLIGACIENGFNTRHLIIKWLRVAGLDPKHVAARLDEQTGTVPGVHLWRCDDEGVYHLLDPGWTSGHDPTALQPYAAGLAAASDPLKG